jgi:hypothetical protein
MTTCLHRPACPSADAADRDAAEVVAAYPAIGLTLLCNGVALLGEPVEPLRDEVLVAA